MQLSRLERYNLVDEVYSQIKKMILSGEWKEGDKIPSENQLCGIMNVSRVVVREALQRLRNEMMIVTYQGMGTFVANPRNYMKADNMKSAPITELSREEFDNIMEFRECLETYAVERSVKTATDSDLKLIKDAANEMENCEDDIEKFNEADYRFHMSIISSSHNDMMVRAMESGREQIMYCLNKMNRLNDSRPYAVDLHHKIAECICNRDAKQAIRLLKSNGEYNTARMAQIIPEKEKNNRQNT